MHSPCLPRKRAQSENYFDAKNVAAVDDHFIENSSDVLARVVLALSTFENATADDVIATDTDDGGFDLFSDEDILEDEKLPERPRAKSLFYYKAQSFKRNSVPITPPLTWSGDNTHIQQYVNNQYREEKKMKDDGNSNADPNSVKITVDEKEIRRLPEQNRRQSIFQTFSNMFGRRNTVMLDKTLGEDPTPIKKPISPIVMHRDAPKAMPNLDWLRRSSDSTLNSASSDNILENTTIADLIRAIETAHIKNQIYETNENSMASTMQSVRRASLTPAKRDATIAFASKTASKNVTPPLATKPNLFATLHTRRSSLAPPQSNQYVMRQNSSPTARRRNFFEVSKVDGIAPLARRSSLALAQTNQNVMRQNSSPTARRSKFADIKKVDGILPSLQLCRRFSAFPAQSASTISSPIVQRRTHVKQPMSPLALSPPPQYPLNDTMPPVPKQLNVLKQFSQNEL